MLNLQGQNPEISEQDREFAEKAMSNSLMKLKLAELATNKGFSKPVKDLATQILNDHKKADDVLREIATNKSIPIQNKLDDDQQKRYNTLADKVGEDFDRAYTDWVVDAHKDAISHYETETKKGENTELRAFATNALPSLVKHKNMAEQTCKKIRKKS